MAPRGRPKGKPKYKLKGRPKGAKNRFSGEPHNLAFWKITLKRPEEINAFLNKGSQQQKITIKEILKYLKIADKEFFNQVNGDKILKELK